MRFSRFVLDRYGHFADFALDFGDRPTDGPDLHLVYGPNEAGKSTISAGMLDFLFGIPNRSNYAFFHESSTLALTATLDMRNEALRLKRKKAAKNDLRDADDRPFPADALAAHLGRLNRDAYAAMFSLDEDTLADGGKGLIDAKGDFGEMLYGASAGVAAFSERLAALTAEADAIHRPNARNTSLRKLRERLAENGAARNEVEIRANAFRKLKTELDSALASEAAAVAAAEALRLEAARLARRIAAAPLLAELHDLRRTLEPLASLPETPAGWEVRAQALGESQARLGAERQAVDRRSAEAAKALAEAPEADAILALVDELEHADFALRRSRYDLAVVDIPKREEERAEHERAIADGRAALDLAADEQIALDAGVQDEIEHLLQSWPALKERRAAAETELKAATAKAGDDAPSPDALSRLEAALAAAEASEALGARSRRRENQAAAEAKRDAAMMRLAPWQGDADALAALAVPSAAKVEAWAKEQDRLVADVARARDRKQAAGERLNQASAAMTAAEAKSDVLSDAEFAELLAARDAGWDAHLSSLDAASAAAFERLMRQTDAAAAARLAAAGDMADRRAAAAEFAAAEVVAAQADKTLADAETAFAVFAQEIAAAATGVGLPADTTLADMRAWLEHRERALEAAADVATEAAAGAALHRNIDALRKALLAGLAEVDTATEVATETDFVAMMHLARDAAGRGRRTLEAATAADGRRREFDTAEADVARWREAWTAAVKETWLAEVSPESAQTKLARHRDIVASISKREELDHRIDEMRKDIARFRAQILSVAERLDETPAEDFDAAALADALGQRLARAKTAAALRLKCEADRDAAVAAADELAIKEAIQDAALGEMTAFYGVDGLTAVAAAIAAANRRDDLQKDRARLERDIQAAVEDAGDLAAAEAALAELEPAAAEATLADLKTRIEAADAARTDATAARARAEDALARVGADSDVARLAQERQTLLMEVQDEAERYLRLKLGAAVAARALERYRARHRTSMLDRASEAFATITRGSFRGLTTQTDKGDERLIAVRADGAARVVDQHMSVGTRAQLYLALRVAGYHEFAKSTPPPPFIADDIIETFDDARAAETFRVLADMATTGQVIYLTHHAHLKDIARAVAPGVKIHDLPDPVSSP